MTRMNVSPDSVRVNGVVLGFLFRSGSAWGAVTMKAFGMDSGGWPVAPGSESSHDARHGLSRRAFIGGPAAAAAGPSLGSGVLWPVAASAWSAENARGFSLNQIRPGTTSVFGQLSRVRNGIFSH